MAKLGGIYVDVRAKLDQYKSDLEKSKAFADRAAAKIQKSLDSITFKHAAMAAAAASGIAIVAMKQSIDLAKEQEAVEKRLEAVLKSTGYAAGFNADQLKTMAGEMQKVTTTGDEMILKNMAMLATFKKIQGEGFERATKSALDMAEVMQTDVRSAIIMIGKALNDPIANLSAMSRAGVQFTKEQKAMVKQLWEANRIAEAQAIILSELESQFGGAAKVARDTFGGAMKAAENAFGDLQEQIGFAITKNETFIELVKEAEQVFIRAGDAVAAWVEANDDLIAQRTHEAINEIKSSIETLLAIYNSLPDGVIGATGAGIIGKILFGATAGKLVFVISLINTQLSKLGMGLGDLVEKHKASTEVMVKLWDSVRDAIGLTNDEIERSGGVLTFPMPPRPGQPTPGPPPQIPLPTGDFKKAADLYKELYQTTGLEEYAQKAVAANAKVLDSSMATWSQILKDDQAVSALRIQEKQKFHNELYAKEIAAQQKINESLAAARKKDFEESAALYAKAEEERLEIVQAFNEKYGELGETRFDIERAQLDERVELLRAAGIEENKIKQMISDENVRIAQEETNLRLEQNQLILENTASMAEGMSAAWENHGLRMKSEIQEISELSTQMADSFASGIGEAYAQAVVYGENLSSSFANLTKKLAAQVISSIVEIGVQRMIQWAVSKVIGATEATSRMGILAAETYAGAFASTAAIPVVGPAMAPAVAGASTAAMLAGAAGAAAAGSAAGMSIASFDSGGVSNARGVYQTGPIREAHVPIPSGKIPVEINGGQEPSPTEITIMNSVDPQVMDAWAASSRGQNAIFNIIGSQPQRLRRLVR
jgi:hypothetical protein